MSPADRAETIVLAWARRYTRGLPPEVTERRVSELVSDCYEQRCWGREVGASPVATATSMVARTVAGMPADVRWRHAHLAAAQDQPLLTREGAMNWIARRWWVLLGGILGVMEVALGAGLPFEEDTTGALVGGIVIATFGAMALTGIWQRRRHRVRGDLMIAAGMLPLMPFLWTIVLPLAGVMVIVAACVDAADARVQGIDVAASQPVGRDRALWPIAGVLAAAILAAIVVGDDVTAVMLVTPPLALLLAHLGLRHRMPGLPLARVGLTLATASLASSILWAAAAIIVLDEFGPPDALGTVINLLVSAGLVAGVVMLIVGLRRGRDQARPA